MNLNKKIKIVTLFYCIFSWSLQAAALLRAGDRAVCSVPVASIWSEAYPPELGEYQADPAKILPPLPLLGSVHVPHHSTQLLYGERVEIIDESRADGWVKVQSFEQTGFNQALNTSQYVDGWVRRDLLQLAEVFVQPNLVVTHQWATVYAQPDDASPVIMHVPFAALLCGTRHKESAWYRIALYNGQIGFIATTELSEITSVVSDADIPAIRSALVMYAQVFVHAKSPYLWGGRSSYNINNFEDVTKVVGTAASVDCSGLVNLIYRACGLSVPRNSYAQYLKATPIKPAAMQPGDLVFLEIANAAGIWRIRHVLIYTGTDEQDNVVLIESTGGDAVKEKCTRITTTQANYGIKNLKQVVNGQMISRYENGTLVGNAKIYCGTFLDREHMYEQRNELLVV